MLKMEMTTPNYLKLTASGTNSGTDVTQFVSEFEQIAEQSGAVRMLIELDNFKGWDASGLWEDLKFDMSHQSDMKRIAIVGDETWQEWGTWLSKPFFAAEMRYFNTDEAQQAEDWLLGQS